ncbi:MAG TPA: tail fiber domain-containing protein, partial [Candidatus Babeliales bacterium]|nr:tail fiber domain-containing protein [Candidatus Babeliales bacterium]
IGDVTGTQGATIVSSVGGQTAANIAAATVLANAATSTNSANTIVKRDTSGNFLAGTITANLTGAASLNVLKAGDTMTGTLIIPAGTAAAPSIQFTGSTNTGLSSATANTLSFDTNGVERMNISATGNVTINGLNTLGIVHNNIGGLLTTSLIVNADVDPAAAIIDTKLATISTTGKVANSATTATNANTVNAIVARDASGNFLAGTITANLTGAASLNVLKSGDTMTGILVLPAGTSAIPSIQFIEGTNTGLSSATANTLSFDTNGTERMNIGVTGNITINGLTSLGIVHNSAAGLLSTSLIVNADIDPTAAVADTKLATITTTGKVANSATTATNANTINAIVARDASGNFSAGTISITDGVYNGNIILNTDPSSSTAGNILKGANRFIHNFGTNNTFVGLDAGNFTMTGTGFNVGIGNNALLANTTGNQNTALGVNTLASNTTGVTNIAIGVNALTTNTFGGANIAIGVSALTVNISGGLNTAIGHNTMSNNTTGSQNTSIGHNTLTANTTGIHHVAVGVNALLANTTGIDNTAIGYNTLSACTMGSNNIAIGSGSGAIVTTGTGNIYINSIASSATETNTIRIGTNQTNCFIQGINGVTSPSSTAVRINAAGLLGTVNSSRRFKHDIQNIDDKSNDIFQLRPVTFIYNNDETESLQYGLIAEEVEEIFPTIVIKDSQGLPVTIQYDVLPILLLNEIKKQQITIEKLNEETFKRDALIQNLLERISALEMKIKTV